MTRKISRGNFLAENQCFYVIWVRDGEGLGLLRYMGLSEIGEAPRGMVFELFMYEKGVNFYTHWTVIGYVFHSGLALSILFTRSRLFPH